MNRISKGGLLAGAFSGSLACLLAPSIAEAACTIGGTLTLVTVNCTGTSSLGAPISHTTPAGQSLAITLGSDGNPANVFYTAGTPITVSLGGGPGTSGSLDTGNTGTPSSITGSSSGFVVTSTGGANILIGQNSAGGNGLNANITGQNGSGIIATADTTGSVAITMAPGTTVTGTTGNAINVSVVNGAANVTVNGNVTAPPPNWGIRVNSSGSGNITIGGSGNVLDGGLGAFSTGTGNILIQGTGNTNYSGTFFDLEASISNAASTGGISITRSGTITAPNTTGIYAVNAGSGPISITGTGNVSAGSYGIYAAASGGDVTISPAGSVTGTVGIAGYTTGSGNVTISTAGNVSGSSYGIVASVASGTETINIGASSTVSGTTGAIDLLGANSVINNAGIINGVIASNAPVPVVDPLTINNFGAFNINSANGSNVQNVTNFNGKGGTLGVTVNPSAGTADLLKVTNLSGSTTIVPTVVGPTTTINTPINVIEAANVAGGTTVNANNSGLFTYGVKSIADPSVAGQTDYQLFSALNVPVAAAAPQTINTVITALETGFFQNSSAFISEPANPKPNQINGGPWIRFGTGNDRTFDTATAFTPGAAPTNAAEKVSTDFSGFQAGVDLGVANVQNTGWNTHIGITTGLVALGVNDLITTTISNQTKVTFVGLYAAITGHGFFADAQVRGDFYAMNINNPTAGLVGAPLSGSAIAFNSSAGYHFTLPHSWFVEPSVAFLYDSLNVATLSYGAFGSQTFNPFLSELGRFGVRVGTTFIFDNAHVAVQPFAVGSVWHEFAGPTTSTFLGPGGINTPLSVTRIGTFGQASLGVSAQVLQTGFVGFARGDYRFGDYLQGYAAVVGLRYAF